MLNERFYLYGFRVKPGMTRGMETIHKHQHRLDRKHNALLLMIPGLIFALVILVYCLFRTPQPLYDNQPLDNVGQEY